MIIVASSDWHLDSTMVGNFDPVVGVHETWFEAFRMLDRLVELCNEVDADLLVVAGDVFNTGRPTSEAVARMIAALKRLSRTKVVFVNGNHDQATVIANHRTPLDVYMDGQPFSYHVSQSPEVIDADGARLALVPWLRVAGSSKLLEASVTLAADVDRLAQEGVHLLFGHITVSECTFSNGVRRGSELRMITTTNEADVPTAVLDRGPWYLGRYGHIHKRQELSEKSGYIGSLHKVDFGERDELKGAEVITLTETGATSVFVPFDTRQLLVADLTTGEGPLTDSAVYRDRDVLRVILPNGAVLGKQSVKAKAAMEARGVRVEVRFARPETPAQSTRSLPGVSLVTDPATAMANYLQSNVEDPEFRMAAMAHFRSLRSEVTS